MIGNYINLPCRTIEMKFLSLCNVPSGPFQYYYTYTLSIKLLLADAIGCSMVLSGTLSFWHVVPSHVSNRAAPRPTPNVSFLR